MRVLTIYPNCSLGGMATVYRNRARSSPNDEHWFIFLFDRGGLLSYANIENATVRIIPHNRIKWFLRFITKNIHFDEIRITSLPEQIKDIEPFFTPRIIYEFHAPEPEVISKELAQLDCSILNGIYVPTESQKKVVLGLLDTKFSSLVNVVPNLLDLDIFNDTSNFSPDFFFGEKIIPLVWVGRFDARKNPRDFLRILSILPECFIGIFVTSNEYDTTKLSSFLAEAYAYQVQDRVRFFMNINPTQMAMLFKSVALNGGCCCSTALDESYGYTIIEAINCGLQTIAYEIGAITEHSGENLHFIDIGDIYNFAHSIRKLTEQTFDHL